MKNTIKKLFCLLLSAALLLTIIPAAETQAAGKYSFPTQLTVTYYPGSTTVPSMGGYLVAGLPKSGKIQKLTSSNKKVLTVSKEYNKDIKEHLILLTAKKAGTSTVSFTVKYGKTTQKFKCRVTVKKYSNALSSYKLGGKNITSKFAKKPEYNLKFSSYKNKKLKISVKPKKGWALAEIGYFNGKTYKDLKNNASVKITRRYSMIDIALYNTKTDQYIYQRINFK